METHQGYEGGSDGAKCSDCGEWIEPGEEAVLLLPAEVDEDGHVETNAMAMHGVLHKSCFEDL